MSFQLEDLKPNDPSGPPTLVGRLTDVAPGAHAYASSRPTNNEQDFATGTRSLSRGVEVLSGTVLNLLPTLEAVAAE